MNVIQGIQPVTRVFQTFGLSVASSIKFKKQSFDNFLKVYSVLHIAIRLGVFSYTLATDKFFIRSSLPIFKTIDTVLVSGARLIEIANMVEALLKYRQEKHFMDNLLQVDDILGHHFNVDMDTANLRQTMIKRLIAWICTFASVLIGVICLSVHNTQYFYLWLTIFPPFLTSSLTYFQIITWVDLIRYRFHKVNKLVHGLSYDRQLTVTDVFRSVRDTHNSVSDAQILDKCVIFCDLYRRLWTEANLVNERFKCSMVFNIGNDFVSLVLNLYWIFLGILKKSRGYDVLPGSSCLSSFISIFHLWMLSRSCHNAAEEAKRTAYGIHSIKHVTQDKKLCLFIQQFSLQMLHQRVRFNAFGFFDVDYTLIFMIMGTTTTYLIILIQFSERE